MKNNPAQPTPSVTKAEEAAWWRENSDLVSKHLRAAVKAGDAKNITADELRRRIEATKKKRATVVALRIPQDDLAMARKQAGQKGLPYQTYIKSLLHEALTKHEKRNAGPKPGARHTTENRREERVPKGKKP